EEEAPEWELVDGEGDDAPAAPVVEDGDGEVTERRLPLVQELGEAVEVADHSESRAARQPRPPAAREAGHNGEGTAHRHAEEQRNRQVEGCRGSQGGELDKGGDEELAIIVVVDVAAGEERVVGRHIAAAQNGVEVGELHRLLAAVKEVPEVGVERAYPGKGEEGSEEGELSNDEQPPARADESPERVAPQPCKRTASRGQQREGSHHHPTVKGQDAQTRGQPDKPSEQ